MAAGRTLDRPDQKVGGLPQEAINALVFLEEFCKFSDLPRTAIEQYIPSFVFNQFKH